MEFGEYAFSHNSLYYGLCSTFVLWHFFMGSLGKVSQMDAVGRDASVKYECLLFDMDDTLYPWSSGLNLACRKNIEEYMLQYLKIEESEVPRMCLELYREYGTTMAGLKALGYDFDNDEFHAYVHGRLPYEKLKPDPVLKNLLLSMPQRKIVFTNADKAHALQVLHKLGLDDCFEGIICFETLNPPEAAPEAAAYTDVPDDAAQAESEKQLESAASSHPRILCKPSPAAFEAALRIANINPTKTLFFDDSARNIASAKQIGLPTVIVGSSVLVPGADYALNSIHNIKEAIPEIWDGEGGEQLEQVIQSASVETFVLA